MLMIAVTLMIVQHPAVDVKIPTTDHFDDCTDPPCRSELDSPVALWPALFLILQSFEQAAPVQDGRVDTHVVHEGEGGVKAHVGLIHPVPSPPLLPLLLLFPSILPGRSLCQVEPLYGQRPLDKNT